MKRGNDGRVGCGEAGGRGKGARKERGRGLLVPFIDRACRTVILSVHSRTTERSEERTGMGAKEANRKESDHRRVNSVHNVVTSLSPFILLSSGSVRFARRAGFPASRPERRMERSE